MIPEIIQCPTESLRALPVPDVSAAVQNSDIAFDVTYVPAGFSLGIETATACGDNVVRITRAYVRNGPASQVPISITRIEREPVVGALAPIGRMEAMTIGGHPSVLVHPADNAAPTEIVMRDDVSVWLVSSNLDTAEVIKIAARLK